MVTGPGGTASPFSRRGNKFDSPQTSFFSSSSSPSLNLPLTQARNGISGPLLTASATPLQGPPAAPPGGSLIGADRANPAAGGRIGGGDGYLSNYGDAADPEPTPAAGLYGDAADPTPLPVYKSGRKTTVANAAVLRTSSAVGATGSTAGGVAGTAAGAAKGTAAGAAKGTAAGAVAPRTAAAIGSRFGDAADPEPTSYYPSTRGTPQTRSDLCIPRNETARTCVCPFSTFMYLSGIYKFSKSVHLFCCSKIGGPIVRIYTVNV